MFPAGHEKTPVRRLGLRDGPPPQVELPLRRPRHPSDFAKQVAEIKQGRKEPVFRVGDIDVTRDFTDVRDVVRAYLALLEAGRNGETYNVCSQREYSIRSLLTAMLKMFSINADIVPD